MQRHVVAMGGGGFSMDDPALDRFVLSLVDAARPKVCFVPTASGDADGYVARFYEAFPTASFDARVLLLFEREVADVTSFLGEHDVVYVGGGNTANLLAVWRLHGVEVGLRRAWEAGVVMAGVSAGANCWFEASTTDSFMVGQADVLADGLGMVAGSFCPHYEGEPERRPRFRDAVASGSLPAGIACDDFAAVHLVGDVLVEGVASTPGAGAYSVTPGPGGWVEEPIAVRRLEGI